MKKNILKKALLVAAMICGINVAAQQSVSMTWDYDLLNAAENPVTFKIFRFNGTTEDPNDLSDLEPIGSVTNTNVFTDATLTFSAVSSYTYAVNATRLEFFDGNEVVYVSDFSNLLTVIKPVDPSFSILRINKFNIGVDWKPTGAIYQLFGNINDQNLVKLYEGADLTAQVTYSDHLPVTNIKNGDILYLQLVVFDANRIESRSGVISILCVNPNNFRILN